MKIIDANIVLRYLLNDVNDLADKAAIIIENDDVFIPVEIIAEIVYVLEKVYKVNRNEILAALTGLTKYENICINEQEVVCSALKYYASLRLDFVDCLLLSYNTVKKIQVESFDDKLKKHLERISNSEF
jgi:predicted nucleic-acid-binding protein